MSYSDRAENFQSHRGRSEGRDTSEGGWGFLPDSSPQNASDGGPSRRAYGRTSSPRDLSPLRRTEQVREWRRGKSPPVGDVCRSDRSLPGWNTMPDRSWSPPRHRGQSPVGQVRDERDISPERASSAHRGWDLARDIAQDDKSLTERNAMPDRSWSPPRHRGQSPVGQVRGERDVSPERASSAHQGWALAREDALDDSHPRARNVREDRGDGGSAGSQRAAVARRASPERTRQRKRGSVDFSEHASDPREAAVAAQHQQFTRRAEPSSPRRSDREDWRDRQEDDRPPLIGLVIPCSSTKHRPLVFHTPVRGVVENNLGKTASAIRSSLPREFRPSQGSESRLMVKFVDAGVVLFVFEAHRMTKERNTLATALFETSLFGPVAVLRHSGESQFADFTEADLRQMEVKARADGRLHEETASRASDERFSPADGSSGRRSNRSLAQRGDSRVRVFPRPEKIRIPFFGETRSKAAADELLPPPILKEMRSQVLVGPTVAVPLEKLVAANLANACAQINAFMKSGCGFSMDSYRIEVGRLAGKQEWAVTARLDPVLWFCGVLKQGVGSHESARTAEWREGVAERWIAAQLKADARHEASEREQLEPYLTETVEPIPSTCFDTSCYFGGAQEDAEKCATHDLRFSPAMCGADVVLRHPRRPVKCGWAVLPELTLDTVHLKPKDSEADSEVDLDSRSADVAMRMQAEREVLLTPRPPWHLDACTLAESEEFWDAVLVWCEDKFHSVRGEQPAEGAAVEENEDGDAAQVQLAHVRFAVNVGDWESSVSGQSFATECHGYVCLYPTISEWKNIMRDQWKCTKGRGRTPRAVGHTDDLRQLQQIGLYPIFAERMCNAQKQRQWIADVFAEELKQIHEKLDRLLAAAEQSK